ncbi:MAG: sodium/proline symporter PutP [Cellulosilyticaceae bacterium]
MEKQLIILITFILYIGLMIAIGGFFYKKTNNLSDYVLGGRGLGKWVTSLSAQASDMSGWLLMGLPGAAYIMGLSGSLWMALGLAIGTYLNWRIVAKRLRISTEKLGDSITLSSYLENRFEDRSKVLKIASSIFILVFFSLYTASGFVAGGKLFSSVFGLNYQTAVLIGSLVVVGYTFLGGFMAVCWTDLIQGLIMFVTILILPCIVLFEIGGLGALTGQLDPVLFNAFHIPYLAPANGPQNMTMALVGIISSLAWGLGYFGQPHILTRFMAIRDPEEIKRSRQIAIVWVIFSLIGATCLGIIGNVAFPGLESSQSENIFIFLVDRYVPVFLSGILLSAILAAIMSTADSQLLVTASAVSEDLYRGIFKKTASDKELVWVGRITVLIVACIAAFIALKPDNSVLGLVSWAWAGFGASFGPVILLSLFWKKMTKQGAIAGMIMGGIVTLVWPSLQLIFPNVWVFYIYEILPGFIMATLSIYFVSNLFKEEMVSMSNKIDALDLE